MSEDPRTRHDQGVGKHVALEGHLAGERSPASRYAYLPSIYGALVLFLFTVGAFYLIAQLRFLVILIYLSILVACGIAGPVGWLERHGLNKALAILVIYALVGGVLVAIGWYAIPPLLGQAGSFAEELPDYVNRAQDEWERLGNMQQEYPFLGQFDDRLQDMLQQIGGSVTTVLLGLPTKIATAFFAVTTLLTFSFLMLMTWERIRALILSLIHPRHRTTTNEVLDEIGSRLGAYLRAKIIIMAIVGAWMYVTLAFLGSPYAMIAAIVAGLMEGLPRIGPWIGRVAIVIAALPLGWKAVVIAVVAHIIIDNIKGYGLSPLIEGNQVDIHPLTAFIAVIAGGILLGWVGAFIAVPTAAVIQVIVQQVLIPWRQNQIAGADGGSDSVQ